MFLRKKPTKEEQEAIDAINAAFDAKDLKTGCALQREFRKRFGHDHTIYDAVQIEPEEPAIYVGVAGARTGGYRRSGASRRP
jgi:hypothetical protein